MRCYLVMTVVFRNPLVTLDGWCQGQRFFRLFRADLSIKKSSSFLPPLIAATSQRGFAPRPAQVSPERLRYFGGTFRPFKTLPPPRTILRPPSLANCFS